ncbi:MAG: GLPGLI family protein [Prevotella sp.]|nr:GLPGLI family protein [Prevotella sp.]
MKKVLLLLVLAACAANVTAQKDSTVLSVTYETTFMKFTEEDSLSRDLMRLDIGEHSSQFVSIVSEWFTKNKDKDLKQSPYRGYNVFRNTAYKNLPEQGIVTGIHMPGWVTLQDSMADLFEWQLLDGDSTICEYPCKKAVANFRGRTWTVWYTLDLPYSDGPWKFCGLPGLILSAKESEGIFSFSCVGIEQGDGHTYEFPNSKRLKVVTPKRAEELMILEGEDNDAYMSMMTGFQMKTTAIYDANGNPVPIVPKHAVLLERTSKKK